MFLLFSSLGVRISFLLFSAGTVKKLHMYLNIKLEIALVHLSGHHTLDDFHWHKLVTIVGRAKNVVGFSFLNF